MRSLVAARLLSSFGLLAPLTFLACSDDPADPPVAPSAGAAGASGKQGSGNSAGAGAGGAAGKGAAGGGAAGKGEGGGGAAGKGEGGAGTAGNGSGGSATAGAGGEPAGGAGGQSVVGGNAGTSGAGGMGEQGGASGSAAAGGGGENAGGSAGQGGGAAGAPSTRKRGIVELLQVATENVLGPDVRSKTVTAVFRGPAQPDPAQTCTTKVEGDCSVRVCTATGTGGAPTAPYLDAGNITATNVSQPVQLSFDNANTGYAPFVGTGFGLFWTGGDIIDVKALGGSGIAAFDAQIKAPKDAVVSVIAPTSTGTLGGANYAVDRDKPFKISWGATANADIEVAIATPTTNGTTATVSCTFDATSSPREVPRTLLGDLSKASKGSISIQAVNRATVTQADADVDVRLAMRTIAGEVTTSGFGNVGPTAPGVCEAAADATASSCPGTPFSAATCASGDNRCDACLSQKQQTCESVAKCDGLCGVVTPGSQGYAAGVGPTPVCSAACKANHCTQFLGFAAFPEPMAVIGDILLFASLGSKGTDVRQMSAVGGTSSLLTTLPPWPDFQLQGGFLYGVENLTLSRHELATKKTTTVLPGSRQVDAKPALDAAGVAYVDSIKTIGVVDLDGKNVRSIARSTLPVFGIGLDATYVYVLLKETGKTATFARVLRAAAEGTTPPETVIAGIPLENGFDSIDNLVVVGNAAYFVEKDTANFVRVDLATKAWTKPTIPVAKYTGLQTFNGNLYLSSDVGIVRLDGPSNTLWAKYDVGLVTAMAIDNERVYFSATKLGTSNGVRSVCQ